MLILTRRIGESIIIGDDVKVTLLAIKGWQVRLGIDAPKNVTVHREEIYERIRTQAIEDSHELDYAQEKAEKEAEQDAERLATFESNDGRG